MIVLKDSKFLASRADLGNLFHRREAAIRNAQSNIVFVFAIGLSSQGPLSLRLKLQSEGCYAN